MNVMTHIPRSPNDPKVQQKGPSSLTPADRLTHALGWLSLGLGMAELLAPRRITRAIGMEGKENLVRAFGVREIMSGIPTLSVDKQVGLFSRIAGDGIDLVTLATALRPGNPKRGNAAIAIAAVAGITLLDIVAASGVLAKSRRPKGPPRDYSDRSGLPRGLSESRGLARKDFKTPPDMRAAGKLAESLPQG